MYIIENFLIRLLLRIPKSFDDKQKHYFIKYEYE